jgi:hypothetical protein
VQITCPFFFVWVPGVAARSAAPLRKGGDEWAQMG